MIELNEENFLVYALKNYNSPECTGMDDFEEDVKRFKYLKRLFRRYTKTDILSHRLIINHLIEAGKLVYINPKEKQILDNFVEKKYSKDRDNRFYYGEVV